MPASVCNNLWAHLLCFHCKGEEGERNAAIKCLRIRMCAYEALLLVGSQCRVKDESSIIKLPSLWDITMCHVRTTCFATVHLFVGAKRWKPNAHLAGGFNFTAWPTKLKSVLRGNLPFGLAISWLFLREFPLCPLRLGHLLMANPLASAHRWLSVLT